MGDAVRDLLRCAKSGLGVVPRRRVPLDASLAHQAPDAGPCMVPGRPWDCRVGDLQLSTEGRRSTFVQDSRYAGRCGSTAESSLGNLHGANSPRRPSKDGRRQASRVREPVWDSPTRAGAQREQEVLRQDPKRNELQTRDARGRQRGGGESIRREAFIRRAAPARRARRPVRGTLASLSHRWVG